MRDLVVADLLIPLIVVALLAGILGFVVTRQIAPVPHPTAVRLSVVALPAQPTPTPTPKPTPTPEVSGNSSGGSSGGGSHCPAGCQCSGQPGGIVIICH